MKGRARRWIGWGALALAILAALIFALLKVFSSPREAKIAWSYKPIAPSLSSQYFMYPRPQGGCLAVNYSGRLYILDAAGKLIKQQSPAHLGQYVLGAIDSAGVLYLGGSEGCVYAYSSDGELLWECTIPDLRSGKPPPQGSSVIPRPPRGRWTIPMLGPDGKLNVPVNTGEFAVLSRTGKIERCFDVGVLLSQLRVAAVAPEGGFYLAPWRTDVIRISADGKMLWRYPTPKFLLSQLGSSPDGTVYLDVFDGIFTALNPDGSKRWDYKNPDPSPTIGSTMYSHLVGTDGTVYVFSGRHVIAFQSDGTQLWSNSFNGDCWGKLISGNQLFIQESPYSLESRLNEWSYQFNSSTGYNLLPYMSTSELQRLHVVDATNGRIKQTLQLPERVFFGCVGAGGELYCIRHTFTKTYQISATEILRIDMD